jgi:hypothetical protein
VREASRIAESKDPYNADAVCAAAGSSREDVSPVVEKQRKRRLAKG